ncbi:MAG: alpha/beta hydrolase [Candidatus Bipolaricaulota bacterium]|nr:alpha/beta hydrolase [Candidatus Bipolaricaulota bacterium]MDW8110609.1 alpha/beta hydrolase [Candidatus Bipolaricaulota bacterium]
MPKVRANGIQLYYEAHGTGEPLLLIAGIGYGTWLWFKQIPALAPHYHLIAFDNRGAGRSDKPDEEYTVALLAQDAYELLRALGISRAHIFGVSLGGFIAQQLALDHPELVKSLVLCSTSFGGPHMIPPKGEVLQFMAFGAGKETFQYGLELAFSGEYLQQHPDEIAQLTRPMRRNPQPRYAYLRQLMAPLNFCSEDRLSEIHCPVLIMAGEDDPVVPAENSRRLAAKLPQAQWKIFPGTRHLFFIERADEVNPIVLNFLKRGGA